MATARSSSAVPNGLEDGSLVRSAPAARLAAREGRQRAAHVSGVEHATLYRLEQIAALAQCFLGIDVERGIDETIVGGFSHGGREAADQVKMAAGAKPPAVDQRGHGQRRATDDVGMADRRLEIRYRHGSDVPGSKLAGEGLCLFGRARPDRHAIDRTNE